MVARHSRRWVHLALVAGISALSLTRAAAESRVLPGSTVAIKKAQGWCIAADLPPPSWDGPGHAGCEMAWKVLAERNGRTLYSVRYAWPSATRGENRSRVLTEVLFEGAQGSSVLSSLYAVQEDEAKILPAPLSVHEIDGRTVIESRVCMSGTTECGSEFAIWDGGKVAKIENHTVAEIRERLPRGYDLNATPQIDLASLSGKGMAWMRGDADCCPSATFGFKLKLDGTALHVHDMEFKSKKAGSSPRSVQ